MMTRWCWRDDANHNSWKFLVISVSRFLQMTPETPHAWPMTKLENSHQQNRTIATQYVEEHPNMKTYLLVLRLIEQDLPYSTLAVEDMLYLNWAKLERGICSVWREQEYDSHDMGFHKTASFENSNTFKSSTMKSIGSSQHALQLIGHRLGPCSSYCSPGLPGWFVLWTSLSCDCKSLWLRSVQRQLLL